MRVPNAGLAVNKTNPADVEVYAFGKFLQPSEKPQFSRAKVDAVNQPGSKRQFIYHGTLGNSVKFLYREFSGDMARPAFNQEVQFDLSEGRTIQFKGLRLEVINASNTKLEYRILSSFP